MPTSETSSVSHGAPAKITGLQSRLSRVRSPAQSVLDPCTAATPPLSLECRVWHKKFKVAARLAFKAVAVISREVVTASRQLSRHRSLGLRRARTGRGFGAHRIPRAAAGLWRQLAHAKDIVGWVQQVAADGSWSSEPNDVPSSAVRGTTCCEAHCKHGPPHSWRPANFHRRNLHCGGLFQSGYAGHPWAPSPPLPAAVGRRSVQAFFFKKKN